MDEPFVTATAEEVRALIASLWLGAAESTRTIGDVRLAPHQISAVSRIQTAFKEFGGALLCDVVGSGKTYVGAAIASAGKHALIIAPAGLRHMWLEALDKTHTRASFVSIESLSRRRPAASDVDTIVVDEAHHFRNATTIRHRHLADLISGRKVLLMTATPIHNSRRDLETLLALFLGKRAAHLGDAELATIVVRRIRTQIPAAAPIPEVRATEWLAVGDDEEIARAIMSLPPSLPPRDSGRADDLVAHGLVRQWASSDAALLSALRRRLAKASALESSLEAGDYPTASELRSWMSGDDSIQLGFAGLLASPSGGSTNDLLTTVRAHAASLRELLAFVKSVRTLDRMRADQLRRIRSQHPAARIVAFSSYEATVHALFELLVNSDRVAMLTSRGGRVAGGAVSRADIIEQFSPAGRAARDPDRIDLLLTTDLLSEGVNLQRAQVVVHLDLPWTPARIEQRVGRLARLGSQHCHVSVYGLDPPASAERILATSELLGTKWRAAAAALGRECDLGLGIGPPLLEKSPTESHEEIREILSRWWRDTRPFAGVSHTTLASASCAKPGFIALIEQNGTSLLIGSDGSAIVDSPGDLERICSNAAGRDTPIDTVQAARVLAQITNWMNAREASESAGLGGSAFLRSRRKILARIDALTTRMPTHARISRSELIDRARRSASRMHGAAEEQTLERIISGAAEDTGYEWLNEVAAVGDAEKNNGRDRSYRVRAVLLLVPATPSPSS